MVQISQTEYRRGPKRKASQRLPTRSEAANPSPPHFAKGRENTSPFVIFFLSKTGKGGIEGDLGYDDTLIKPLFRKTKVLQIS